MNLNLLWTVPWKIIIIIVFFILYPLVKLIHFLWDDWFWDWCKRVWEAKN